MNEEVLQKIDGKRQALGCPKMTWAEVAKHRSEGDLYIVISNVVYNVTDYAKRHPGGQLALLRHGGKDATTFFERISGHTAMARNNLPNLYVADIGSSLALPKLGSSSAGKGKTSQGNSSCNCAIS
jgi:cytochrome b involved in lipid metabolism